MRGYQDILEQERKDFEQRRSGFAPQPQPRTRQPAPVYAPVSLLDKVLLVVFFACIASFLYFAFFD